MYHIYPDKACIAIDQKTNISFYALSECDNVTIAEIQIMGAPGSVLHEMVYEPSEKQWSRSVSLNSTDHGHHLICARAVDSDLKSSNFSCLQVSIGVTSPYLLKSSLNPIGKLNVSFGILNFSAEFNDNVRKPNSSRLIKIFSSQTQELIQVVSSNNVTFFDNSSKIYFPVNLSLFSDGEFYVLFDYGIAVSTDFCSPISEKIDDELFWKFSVERIDELSTIEVNTTRTILTNSIFPNQTLSYQSNQNCSDQNIKIINEEECNAQTLSLVFILISLIFILLHHIILSLMMRYLKKKYF